MSNEFHKGQEFSDQPCPSAFATQLGPRSESTLGGWLYQGDGTDTDRKVTLAKIGSCCAAVSARGSNPDPRDLPVTNPALYR